MAKTPSPAGPSWIIMDAACDSPSLPKTVWTSTPPTGSWPMSFSSAPSTSHSPAKEGTVRAQGKCFQTARASHSQSDRRCGLLKAQVSSPGGEQGWVPLVTQLGSLSTDLSSAVIVVSPECIAVFRDKSGRYGVFDSHSRNAAGLPYHFGTAITMTFPKLSDLADHLHKLFANRGDYASYEFVPVSFEAVGSSEGPPQSAAQTQAYQSETAFGPLQAEVVRAEVLDRDLNAHDISSAVPQATTNLAKLSKQQRRKARQRERLVEWICHTCDSHLTRGKMPTIAVANNLELAPIPPELAALNVLERQLIAKILPFAKIIALPKGRQRAVHGAVVCVPSEVAATVNTLPRPNTEAQLLQVKLKRHIKYKGYQHFYTVNMKNVLAGLAKLKEIHSEYKDVSIDESATFESLHQDSADEEDSQLINAEAGQPEQVVECEIDLEDVFKSENEPDLPKEADKGGP
ncbi:hypothetical protein D5F01_LYC22325 [Larimichthys crocea]|uniref:DUF6570 domain-containing protein n=1 Tax=Larimichthys crocea TaxID=215358 RepID=A0A6G0HM75_LARCR|nr:hypothetical protein D5F01_LYC22325 [Larimichthys crocea]